VFSTNDLHTDVITKTAYRLAFTPIHIHERAYTHAKCIHRWITKNTLVVIKPACRKLSRKI